MTTAVVPRLRLCETPPPRWPWLFHLFRWYARLYAAKHLHAVRVSKTGPLPARLDGPLVVVLNHPSWWDPLIAFILSGLMPDRVHWGPIDAAALRRYRFLGRAGLFGIELGTTRGWIQHSSRLGKRLRPLSGRASRQRSRQTSGTNESHLLKKMAAFP